MHDFVNVTPTLAFPQFSSDCLVLIQMVEEVDTGLLEGVTGQFIHQDLAPKNSKIFQNPDRLAR